MCRTSSVEYIVTDVLLFSLGPLPRSMVGASSRGIMDLPILGMVLKATVVVVPQKYPRNLPS